MVIEQEWLGPTKKEKIVEPKEEKVELGEFVKEMVSIIDKRFAGLERDIKRLKTDVSSLTAQETVVNRLKADIRDIRSEISSLKSTPKLTMDKKALESLKK